MPTETSVTKSKLADLVADAEKNGFNPLTVLRNGGLATYTKTVATSDFGAGSFTPNQPTETPQVNPGLATPPPSAAPDPVVQQPQKAAPRSDPAKIISQRKQGKLTFYTLETGDEIDHLTYDSYTNNLGWEGFWAGEPIFTADRTWSDGPKETGAGAYAGDDIKSAADAFYGKAYDTFVNTPIFKDGASKVSQYGSTKTRDMVIRPPGSPPARSAKQPKGVSNSKLEKLIRDTTTMFQPSVWTSNGVKGVPGKGFTQNRPITPPPARKAPSRRAPPKTGIGPFGEKERYVHIPYIGDWATPDKNSTGDDLEEEMGDTWSNVPQTLKFIKEIGYNARRFSDWSGVTQQFVETSKWMQDAWKWAQENGPSGPVERKSLDIDIDLKTGDWTAK